MSKHTPGPWRVKYESEPGGAFLIYGPWGGAIDPDADYVTQEENEANCRLIAAAPELDAYRQYIEDNLERIERGGWTPVCFDEFRESEECANYMKEEA